MQLGVLCGLLQRKAFRGSREDFGAGAEEAFGALETLAEEYPCWELPVGDPITVESAVQKISDVFGNFEQEALDYFSCHKDVVLL